MSNILLGSLDHCLLYHSIIGDVTFLVVLIWVNHHSFYFLSIFLLPFFRYLLCFLFISYVDTHFKFDTVFTLFSCFIDSLTIFFSLFTINVAIWLPLGSWLMRFFPCITSYTRGHEFDHWVFKPSFLSFLSPYHFGLYFVSCLKVTLRL